LQKLNDEAAAGRHRKEVPKKKCQVAQLTHGEQNVELR